MKSADDEQNAVADAEQENAPPLLQEQCMMALPLTIKQQRNARSQAVSQLNVAHCRLGTRLWVALPQRGCYVPPTVACTPY